MRTRGQRSHLRSALATAAATISAALWAIGSAVAQPVDAPAGASAVPNVLPGSVRRPPPAKPPPPLGSDPANQPGLGQPVTPQLRIPFGRKPPAATAASGPPPRGNAASSPIMGDAAARCEAMRAEQMRLKCLDQLAREANRR